MASLSTLNAEPAAVDPGFQEVLGRGKRPKNTERMNALIQAEGQDIDNPSRRPRRSRHAPKKQNAAVDPNNFFSSLPVEEASDADDGDFTGSESSSQSSSSGSETDTTEILNVELADVLPMKTVPPRLILHAVGSAVAVERIFSGGRDTISLQSAAPGL
ncbi:hypothetical protein BDR03DRAFT_1018235 [Suillus americanus]|nr:hypothetical protein BDR03DRAFT_1018235 [Suillus americanus]